MQVDELMRMHLDKKESEKPLMTKNEMAKGLRNENIEFYEGEEKPSVTVKEV